MASEGSLLSNLCRICHINPPKYRCPRCSVRTCSLDCSKRHKVWSQCSGVRDPAAYLKRSELATPSAFDRDYNFISGIERGLDRADRDADIRGIELGREENERARRSKWNSGPKKGEVNVQKALERARVIVDRAPKGMTREKENRTSWNRKYKCLSWTVEWFHPDGRRELSGCLETWPLCEGYSRILEKDSAGKKRKRETDDEAARPTPKDAILENASAGQELTRTGEDETSNPAETQNPENAEPIQSSTQPTPAPHDPEVTDSQNLESSNPTEPPPTPSVPSENANSTSAPPTNPPQSPQDQQATDTPTSDPPAPHSEQNQDSTSSPQESNETKHIQEIPNIHMYLLRPHTASSSKVLIPVAQSSSLAECLRERVVLEYPTFYILLSPPPSLPDGFILEADYLGQQRAEEEEMRELLAHVDVPQDQQQSTTSNAGQDDEQARNQFVNDEVLRVLQKDMVG
ncbi:hypothetical protein L228DRAFT_285854 [Xylona heveae TC161]|uniref:Box C/D snoRNA protein 1 n=1 Tax=Xylona heveae (strain CBS 132557 / TC161) TaxID=1328760 RepID=A0A164ZRX6_XYLHT|nr:hypothetical protein L228DRAFT_285854 [Xylona heveae TC161]KZF19436.1 hypothetical protein L228DRAFT_285854 [Xylona heveae TC161]